MDSLYEQAQELIQSREKESNAPFYISGYTKK